MSRHQPAAGFTLIEILVSIGIFLVSSTIMLAALTGATETFRRGEAGRQAGDEATTVLAALQEDISRATPVRIRDGQPAKEWGRLVATAGAAGNCRLELVIENPDRSQMRWVGPAANRIFVGVRKKVVWYVDPGNDPSSPEDDALVRQEWDLGDNGQVMDADTSTLAVDPLLNQVMTRGCLHFSVYLELGQAHRPVTSGTSGPVIDWVGGQPPYAGSTFDTWQLLQPQDASGAPLGPTFWPQADAIRVAMVLTGGGRYITRGYTAGPMAAGDKQARITGIKALPSVNGSMLRIGNEWVRYGEFRNNTLTDMIRGDLRTTDTAWGNRTPVFAGQMFSLVAELPR